MFLREVSFIYIFILFASLFRLHTGELGFIYSLYTQNESAFVLGEKSV